MIAYVIDASGPIARWNLLEVERYWTHDLYGPVVTAEWFSPSTRRVQRNTFPLDVIAVMPL